MRGPRTFLLTLRILAALVLTLALNVSVAFAQAQAPIAPGPSGSIAPAAPPSIPPAPGGSAAEGSHALAVFAAAVVLLLIIGLLARWSTLRHKRETEAVELEAQISDALLRERELINLGVLPRVHVPFWKGTPATVQMTGHVPSPELREEVLRVAAREATRIRPDVHIYDRIAVGATPAAKAA